jgi:hypothetical protein
MNYNEALAKAEEIYNGESVAMDETIAFRHCDGSECQFNHAAFRTIDESWMVVFTEHFSKFVFHREDVEWVKRVSTDLVHPNDYEAEED